MHESPPPHSRSSEVMRDGKRSEGNKYDDRAASSHLHANRVGVYDRPEGSSVRSGSMVSIVLLLIAVLIAVYFLFFAHHLSS
jgi:hypothetical protein